MTTNDDGILLHSNYGGATKRVPPHEVPWHEQNGWTRADRTAAWQIHPRRGRHNPAHTGPIPTQPDSHA